MTLTIDKKAKKELMRLSKEHNTSMSKIVSSFVLRWVPVQDRAKITNHNELLLKIRWKVDEETQHYMGWFDGHDFHLYDKELCKEYDKYDVIQYMQIY